MSGSYTLHNMPCRMSSTSPSLPPSLPAYLSGPRSSSGPSARCRGLRLGRLCIGRCAREEGRREGGRDGGEGGGERKGVRITYSYSSSPKRREGKQTADEELQVSNALPTHIQAHTTSKLRGHIYIHVHW